ncbi:ABC transporter permease [Faecalibacter bovis]|uniref:ABC transporter permease n=1 Tax=Faecalibacter bovis TaxID=2898187 RepID=A0ABX7XCQ4_9FLAO|nr:ABC transporter permease subunit [Faecalibacter bovis]QTV05614.1 ABC transporter permease [Faecalibacter bovis]
MNRLLRIEWNKMFYNKGTRIFLILYFILIAIMGAVLPNIKPNLNGIEVDFIKLGALEFPVIWHNIAWVVGFGKFFLAIIVINNISNEYSFGTFKQNTIDGLTKLEFFSSKLIMNILFAIASSLLVLFIVLGLGLNFSKEFNLTNGIEFLAGFLVEIITFISFAMFLAFLLKKSTFATLSIFVLFIIESIFRGSEAFIRLKNNQINDEELTFITSYLPITSNGKIIGFPPGSISQYMMNGKFFTESHVQWDHFGMNIFYTILFLGLSYLLIKKRDL